MLTGEDLGGAIRSAIKLKGVSVEAVARHFGVKGPSVHGWMRTGRVGKQRIEGLVAYFSDVVGPEHWGFSEEAAPYLASRRSPEQGEQTEVVKALCELLGKLSREERAAAGGILSALASAPDNIALRDSLATLLRSARLRG